MTFDVHIMDIWGTLSGGGAVVLPDPDLFPDPDHLSNLIASVKVNNWQGVPTLLKAVMDHIEALSGWHRCQSLTRILGSGEKVLDIHVNGWLANIPGLTVWNAFGPAECTVLTHYAAITKVVLPNEVIPIGVPLPGYECYLLDTFGRLIPPYVTGELYIGGPGVMTGYWGQPELTSKVLRHHKNLPGEPLLYKTGDLCHWNDKGELMFEGRADFQVKIRGQRLELGEIEAVIRGVSGVSSALVMKRNRSRGDYLMAYVVSQLEDDRDLEVEVKRICKDTLPAYMVPEVVMVLSEWPLNANGKVDRKRLPEPDSILIDGTRNDIILPRTTTEQLLYDVYKVVLHRDDLSVLDTWTDAGGHSLLVMQLMSKLRQNALLSMVPWQVMWVFEYPTIESMAIHI
eukprot:gene1383-1839_t